MTTPVSTPDNLWIVIAAYNEAEALPGVIDGLQHYLPRVVVVDDGSEDATVAVAESLGAWSIRHSTNCGQGAALQTGFDFAVSQGAEVVVTLDADGQHSPAEIPELVSPILAGTSDVCLGSRFLGSAPGIPASRRWMLRAAVAFTRFATKLPLTDTHNGMRALSRSALATIRLTHNRMTHASEILHQIAAADLRVAEIPVTVRYSAETLQNGQSGWNSVRILGELLAARLVR